MKKLITSLLFVLFFVSPSLILANDKFTLVIDAGHGGRDGGATRGKTKEKDINLAVALNLGRLIEENCKDVKVIYTRKSDVFLDLDRRAAIANKAKANLFISIHTNSTEATTTTAVGADTYILGLGRSAENMRVAQRENSVIMLEDNYKQRYENFDPKSPESYIIFEFMTNKYMDQSLDFAGHVQSDFKSIAKRVDRGVKQAGFLVLRETACPSVLIELGFINNPSEAKYLSSAIGQRAMASSIFSGFKKYKKSFDSRQGSETIVASNTTSSKSNVAQSNNSTTKNVAQSSTPQTNTAKAQTSTTFVSKPKKDPVIVAPSSKPAPKTENKKAATVNSGVSAAAQPTPKVQPQPTKQPVQKNTIGANEIEYRVQFLISNESLDSGSSRFKGLSPVDVYMDGRTYKYTYGSTTDRNEATRIQREVKAKFKDAFIIKFKNGKRVL